MKYLYLSIAIFVIPFVSMAYTSAPSNSVVFSFSPGDGGYIFTCHPSDQKPECMAILDNFATAGAVVTVTGDPLVSGVYTVVDPIYDAGNARWKLLISGSFPNIVGVGEYTPSIFSTPAQESDSIWGSGGVFGSTTPTQMLATVATGTTTTFGPLVALFALVGVALAFTIAIKVQNFVMLSAKLRRTKDEYFTTLANTDPDDFMAQNRVSDKYKKEITSLERQLSGKRSRGKMGM